jgi:glycine dehydrogenase
MSFPVPGTLMIEPTESESRAELDRFCEAMIAIRQEISEIESGRFKVEASPLRHAPHTVHDIADDAWQRPYSRAEGCFPEGVSRTDKYWSPVGRVDNVYGDRHLVCSCPPVEDYRKRRNSAIQMHRVPDAVQRPSRCTAEPGPTED